MIFSLTHRYLLTGFLLDSLLDLGDEVHQAIVGGDLVSVAWRPALRAQVALRLGGAPVSGYAAPTEGVTAGDRHRILQVIKTHGAGDVLHQCLEAIGAIRRQGSVITVDRKRSWSMKGGDPGRQTLTRQGPP